jgi:hypothetical protein
VRQIQFSNPRIRYSGNRRRNNYLDEGGSEGWPQRRLNPSYSQRTLIPRKSGTGATFGKLMTGVITDRMSPGSETNIFLGPPSLSNLTEKPNCDSNSEIKFIERSPHDVADCIGFFINETTLGQSPQIGIIEDKFVINAILDSGSEVNLLSEGVYEKLIMAGVNIPVLPVGNVVLVTAFGKRSKRIKHQAFIDFTMGNDCFESVFMVSSQLKNEAIIGCQFLKEYGICINFDKRVY